ncbi:glycosyltransferase family 2 protein [Accumulibacter sp.]|jgi:dolichol-phosphate mannosyltransferase|uniref:Glycosyl transferase family 2 n=1 Tax=Accumulibacter regalis TaxID=522306 RepID=C7RT09_ACCRE|nr:glycosyltransferase family 2 protein [Accumulibacter sp.]MBN8496829.1 glycosyltransferase family 2 protein [Accumulibacter sp.]MBO3714716.1 glycosyltransferase family 2 protein [Accumulibacter sp.]
MDSETVRACSFETAALQPVPTPKVRIAVVVPCFRVRDKIVGVIERIGPEVERIYVVDDACPEGTADLVQSVCRDPRVDVIRLAVNQGVGGAVSEGYRCALRDGAQIVVKIDGDGQMAPELVPELISPILAGHADYIKGNRFFFLGGVRQMPAVRLVGNAVLSFLTKLSTGYWQVFDPTNGFTAVSRQALQRCDLARVSKRYFFESDMLFQLALARAVVADFPMKAVYADEQSSLRPMRVVGTFLRGHLVNFARRVLYTYFVRGFSLASVELVIGLLLILFSIAFGVSEWITSTRMGAPATAGTVMLAALPAILGTQLTLSWLHFDIQSEPRIPITSLTETSCGARTKIDN